MTDLWAIFQMVASIVIFTVGIILGAISVIEIKAMRETRKWAEELIQNLPLLAAEAVVDALKDPEKRKAVQGLVLDQEFLESVGAMLMLTATKHIDTMVNSVKQAFYGILGIDAKIDGQIKQAMMEGSPASTIMEFVPKESKLGKMLNSDPGKIMNLLRVLGGFMGQGAPKTVGGSHSTIPAPIPNNQVMI